MVSISFLNGIIVKAKLKIAELTYEIAQKEKYSGDDFRELYDIIQYLEAFIYVFENPYYDPTDVTIEEREKLVQCVIERGSLMKISSVSYLQYGENLRFNYGGLAYVFQDSSTIDFSTSGNIISASLIPVISAGEIGGINAIPVIGYDQFGRIVEVSSVNTTSALLTGLSIPGSPSTISDTDTILEALGKLQSSIGAVSFNWGEIGGDITDQTDLITILNGKFDNPTGTSAEYIAGDGSILVFQDEVLSSISGLYLRLDGNGDSEIVQNYTVLEFNNFTERFKIDSGGTLGIDLVKLDGIDIDVIYMYGEKLDGYFTRIANIYGVESVNIGSDNLDFDGVTSIDFQTPYFAISTVDIYISTETIRLYLNGSYGVLGNYLKNEGDGYLAWGTLSDDVTSITDPLYLKLEGASADETVGAYQNLTFNFSKSILFEDDNANVGLAVYGDYDIYNQYGISGYGDWVLFDMTSDFTLNSRDTANLLASGLLTIGGYEHLNTHRIVFNETATYGPNAIFVQKTKGDGSFETLAEIGHLATNNIDSYDKEFEILTAADTNFLLTSRGDIYITTASGSSNKDIEIAPGFGGNMRLRLAGSYGSSGKYIKSDGSNNSIWGTLSTDVYALLSGTSPISFSSGVISISQSTTSTNGYLSSTDWNTFNNKQNALGYTPVNKAGDTMLGYLTLVGDPTNANHAANKNYVDNLVYVLSWKFSVRVSTTTGTPLPSYTVSGSNTILTATSNGAFPVTDGVTLVLNDTILVKNESGADRVNNGSYKLTQVGDASNPWILTRTDDANTASRLEAATWRVREGSTEANTVYAVNVSPITLGSTVITFAQIAGAGTYTNGTYLKLTGNVFDIDFTTFSTSNITEGSNLYFTTARVLATTLAGFSVGTNATISSSNTILTAFQDVQAQLNNKQPLDATLTALAAFNSNGIIVQTAADTFTARTITGTSNRIDITNGNGVSGNPTIDISSTYVGQTSITTLGTIATGTWSATTIAANKGGTGISSYAVGDLLYADTTSTLAKLADVATGNALISGGVATAPSWGKIGLTTHISGVLAIANGGTNSSTSLNNNRVMVSSGGAIVEAAAITASRALKSDANGIPTHFDTTTEPSLTELSYVKGVTSAIQTQLGTKITQNGDSFAAAMTIGTNDANTLSFETGGVTRVTISASSAQMGIGGTSASAFLYVNSTLGTTRSTFAAHLDTGLGSTGWILYDNGQIIQQTIVNSTSTASSATANHGYDLDVTLTAATTATIWSGMYYHGTWSAAATNRVVSGIYFAPTFSSTNSPYQYLINAPAVTLNSTGTNATTGDQQSALLNLANDGATGRVANFFQTNTSNTNATVAITKAIVTGTTGNVLSLGGYSASTGTVGASSGIYVGFNLSIAGSTAWEGNNVGKLGYAFNSSGTTASVFSISTRDTNAVADRFVISGLDFGFGTTSPIRRFHFSHDGITPVSNLYSGVGSTSGIFLTRDSTSQITQINIGGNSVYRGTRANGSLTTPTTVVDGDIITIFSAIAFDGNAVFTGGAGTRGLMSFVVSTFSIGTITTNQVPIDLYFTIPDNSAASTEIRLLRLNSVNRAVYIGTTDVNSTIIASETSLLNLMTESEVATTGVRNLINFYTPTNAAIGSATGEYNCLGGINISTDDNSASQVRDQSGYIKFQPTATWTSNRASKWSFGIRNNSTVFTDDVFQIINTGYLKGKTAGTGSIAGITATTIGGRIAQNTTQTGNGTTVETDLASYTILGSTLANASDGIIAEFNGTFTANGNNKQIQVYWAGGVILNTTALAFNGASWNVKVHIIRTATTTQKIKVEFYSDSALLYSTVKYVAGTATMANDNILKVTGTGGATNDIYHEFSTINWDGAA